MIGLPTWGEHCMNSYKKLILAVVFLPAAAAVLAQAPPESQPDDRAVTIGIIRNPDAKAGKV
jgi:hypothetical protein